MKIERLILGLIFILMLFLLCHNYAFKGYYQDNSVIDLLNYSESQIMIYGHVTETYNDGFEVYNIRNKEVYHVKTNLKLNMGTGIYILGTLDSNKEVTIIKIMTFKHEGVINVIFRSLLGFIIFLIVFLKFWKFELKKMLFIRRK